MFSIEQEVNNYIAETGKNLICSQKKKKQILSDIKNSVLDYAENKNITDINEIYAHFGSPEEVARNYLFDADPENVRKATSIKKTVIGVLIAAAVFLMTMVIILFMYIRTGQGTITIDINVDSAITEYWELTTDG